MTRKNQADPEKIRKILEKRGYAGGRVRRGHEVHHVKSLAEGGKDILSNLRVIKASDHRRIHKNRRERGEE